MNRKRIANSLGTVLRDEANLRNSAGSPWSDDEHLFLHKLSEPLAEALSREVEFRDGAGYMVNNDMGATGFYQNEAARALIQKAKKLEDEHAAVDWLVNVLKAKSADGTRVMALWGVECTRRISFSDDLELVPFQQVPESPTKSMLQPAEPFSTYGTLISRHHGWTPHAALLSRTKLEPLLQRVDPRVDRKPQQWQAGARDLDDARLALTLIGPSAPQDAGSWFHHHDDDLQNLVAYGGISTQLEEVVPIFTRTVNIANTTKNRTLVRGYMQLPDDSKRKVQMALRRINLAVRRMYLGDKALEIAIALESLLTGQRDQPGEHRHKVSLRAAQFLGGLHSRRLRHRTLVAKIYTLRNEMVHDGQIKARKIKIDSSDPLEIGEVVEEGTRIACLIVEKIIRRGSIPDWYAFELRR